MRRLRLLLLIFFLVVFAVFMTTNIHEYLTSDYTEPVISADEDVMKLSVNATEEDLLRGMTAQDNLDGDVTDSLVVVSKSKFIAKATRNVNYAAFDENNNVGTYTRKLVYTDYHSPRFVITQPLRFVAGNSSYNYLRSVRAIDCLDGNITSQIKITFGDTETASEAVSEQKVNIQVTNSAGDSSVLALTATFEDFDSYSTPSPGLSDYVIYIETGEKPDYRVYLDGIWMAGNTRRFSDLSINPDEDIKIDDSKVDYDAPGVYIVTYTLSHSANPSAGSAYRASFGSAELIVVVEDAA